MGAHARLSPSSAARWTSCTASPDASDGIEDDGSDAAREGTACHQIAEELLIDPDLDPQGYVGRWVDFYADHSHSWRDDEVRDLRTTSVQVPQEMIDAVVTAVNFVRQMHTLRGGELEAEQPVPIGHITGEPGASGTSDVVIRGDKWLVVADFKFGRKKVTAYDVIEQAGIDIVTGNPTPERVRGNLQLSLYALGAIEKHKLAHGEPSTITLVVIQPFLNHVSEYTCSIKELRDLEQWLRQQADETRTHPQFRPSESACHFCKAAGRCKAQTKFVAELALQGFESLEEARPAPVKTLHLGDHYALVPLVQQWCKAVEQRVNEALHAGIPVPRSDGLSYKLVAGKKGSRDWADLDALLPVMNKMRLKQEELYEMKLKSPAQLEKLTKSPKVKKGEEPIPPRLGPTQWNRLVKHIVQPDGNPVVALSNDPRPALAAKADGFDDVPPAEEDNPNADLF